MKKNDQKILISLDDILDTRLAIIEDIDPEAAVWLLDNGYYTRDMDDWETMTAGYIKNSDFNNRYGKRDKNILKKARITGLAPYLQQVTNEIEHMSGDHPDIGLPVVYLNTYPYNDLNDVEIEALKEAVQMVACSKMTEVRVINRSLEELTPEFLLDSYSSFFIYDLEKWKQIQHAAFLSKQCPSVIVQAPRLLIKRVSEADLKPDGETSMCPFAAAELMLMDYFHLATVDVRVFSMLLP